MIVKIKLIRDARLKKEFSQENIADFLKISQSKYSRQEKGEIYFNIDELGKLIDFLDLNPFDVIDFTEKQLVFINSYYSSNLKSKTSTVDKKIIRELIKNELKVFNSSEMDSYSKI